MKPSPAQEKAYKINFHEGRKINTAGEVPLTIFIFKLKEDMAKDIMLTVGQKLTEHIIFL